MRDILKFARILHPKIINMQFLLFLFSFLLTGFVLMLILAYFVKRNLKTRKVADSDRELFEIIKSIYSVPYKDWELYDKGVLNFNPGWRIPSGLVFSHSGVFGRIPATLKDIVISGSQVYDLFIDKEWAEYHANLLIDRWRKERAEFLRVEAINEIKSSINLTNG